jgi:hypothetical protein
LELSGYSIDSIAREHRDDGGYHLHALIRINKKPNIADCRIFDLVEGENIHHPNIDTDISLLGILTLRKSI